MYEPGNLDLDAMAQALVTKELIGKFGTFLLRDENVHLQTSMNYLSSVRWQLEAATDTDIFRSDEG